MAENIKAKRMMELANEQHGFPTKEKLNQNFIAYLHTKVSPSSTSTYFAKVKCTLSESVKDKILIQNPSFFVDPIRVPESSREYLTIEEIQRIKDVVYLNCVTPGTSTTDGLQSLDLTKNTKLKFLDCSQNNLSEIDLSQNEDLVTFKGSSNPFGTIDFRSNLTNVNIRACNDLEGIHFFYNNLDGSFKNPVRNLIQ